MRKTNGQGGITLIALVVTIVVLLILAGITIMYVFGNDGIFKTANDAKVESTLGTVRDYVANAQFQALAESYDPNPTAAFNEERAQEIMKQNFPAASGTTTTAPVVEELTYANHKYGGSMTGTLNGVNYTVTFDTNGVATVKETPPAGT